MTKPMHESFDFRCEGRRYLVNFEQGEPVYIGIINRYGEVMTLWTEKSKRNQGPIITAVLKKANFLRGGSTS